MHTQIPARRRFLHHTLHLGLAALLANLVPMRSVAGENNGGVVRLLKGRVLVNGKETRIGASIPPQAEIRTGKRSMVAFSAGGDAHLLQANASITLTVGNGFTEQLRLLTGALLSAWGERPQGQQALLARGTVTIGIRGTVTYLSEDAFSLLQGDVAYRYTDADGVEHNLQLIRNDDENPVSVDARGKITDRHPHISPEDLKTLRDTFNALREEGVIDGEGAGKITGVLEKLARPARPVRDAPRATPERPRYRN